MTTTATDGPRIVRFFTSTRRIPVMIGKFGGTRVWGGPYTVVQLVVGAATLFGGYYLMPWWGPLVGTSPLVWVVTLVVVAGAATVGAGRIPSTRRKVQNLAVDAVTAVAVPAAGSYNNRAVKLRPAHRVTGTVLVAADTLGGGSGRAVPVAPAAVATLPPKRAGIAPARSTAPAVTRAPGYRTGMDRLLAQAAAGRES